MGSYCYLEYQGQRWQSHLCRDFETYKVGDAIPWTPSFHSPGEHPDGVELEEIYPDAGDPCWVWLVVQGCILRALLPANLTNDDTSDAVSKQVREALRQQFGIQPPPRDLWPELAWEAAAWRKQQREEEHQRELAAYLERVKADFLANPPTHVSEDEAAADRAIGIDFRPRTLEGALRYAEAVFGMNQFTRMRMREVGFTSQMCGEWEELPELTTLIRESLEQEFMPLLCWAYGPTMLAAAANYRGERLLREAGKWEAVDTPLHPTHVRTKVYADRLDVTVVRLTDRIRPALVEVSGDGPVKVLDTEKE